MKRGDVLHFAPEYSEDNRPEFVQMLRRPPPLGRATQLAFLIFEKPCLVVAERFWIDFGLSTVARSTECLTMRSMGPAPAVLVARRGPSPRYVGAAFEVEESYDLDQLVQCGGGARLAQSEIPGGTGEGLRLLDPDGNEVWLLRRWSQRDPGPVRAPLTNTLNSLTQAPRVNQTVRSAIEPAPVGRLGHVVLQSTQFSAMANWYMRHLGLIPTDVQYLSDGEPLLTFFRLDRGEVPTDHHTVVIAGGIENRYEHSAWEVPDLDALGMGQQVLRANGHRHLWGIGRHLLGSQLFDYWLDPDGFEFEHYTDGDLFTSEHPTHYVPFSSGSIWSWGHDVPPSMFPKLTLRRLAQVYALIRKGHLSLNKLRTIGEAIDKPPRPWL